MVRSLLLVWLIGVVAFFVLWAVLAKVVRRISEKKEQGESSTEKTDKEKPAPESYPSEG